MRTLDRLDAGVQLLTLVLDGVTAGDYASRVRDPAPPVLGGPLRSVAVHMEALGDRVELELHWDGEPPGPRAAAVAAGFPLCPEVVHVGSPALSARGALR